MLQAIGKKILVKPIEEKSGLLIVHNQKPKKYQICAIGDEVKKVNDGDRIYLENHYGAEIEHENEKFLVVEESTILAKIID